MAYKYRKRKRRKSKTGKNIRIGDFFVFAAAFALMLGLAFVVKSCAKTIQENNKKTSFTDKDLIFCEEFPVSIYNHNDEKYITMSLDEYVFHVVSGEMPASYDIEALKAQAVAARTYTVSKMTSMMGESADPCHLYENCDICTNSACCQSFKSLAQLKANWGKDYGVYCEKIYKAVTATSGLIAVYNGKPINALYHAVSGGQTESCENVYGNYVPYLVSVSSTGEENATNYKYTENIRYEDFIKAAKENLGITLSKQDVSKTFKVVSRFESGMVKEAELGGKKFTGREIRNALSLKSSNFTIEFSDVYVIIKTKGYGHGVGMSQAGANARAKEGKNFSQILKHYYTGIEIQEAKILS